MRFGHKILGYDSYLPQILTGRFASNVSLLTSLCINSLPAPTIWPPYFFLASKALSIKIFIYYGIGELYLFSEYYFEMAVLPHRPFKYLVGWNIKSPIFKSTGTVYSDSTFSITGNDFIIRTFLSFTSALSLVGGLAYPNIDEFPIRGFRILDISFRTFFQDFWTSNFSGQRWSSAGLRTT